LGSFLIFQIVNQKMENPGREIDTRAAVLPSTASTRQPDQNASKNPIQMRNFIGKKKYKSNESPVVNYADVVDVVVVVIYC